MISELYQRAEAALRKRLNRETDNMRTRLPVEVLTHVAAEANAIDKTLSDLKVDAWVADEDVMISSTGGFIRYRIECGYGVRISAVRAVTADLEIAINDCRRAIDGAGQVRIVWRNGHSFDLTYPFERNTLRWEDVEKGYKPRSHQMFVGRNYETEKPSSMLFSFAEGRDVHVFVGGATGSGKSALIAGMLASLCLGTAPEHLRVLILDPKRDKRLARFSSAPHFSIYTNEDDCVAALHWLFDELRRRQAGADSSQMIVLLLEEISLLMSLIGGKDVIMGILNALAGTARSANIHIIACTQYPSRKILDREFMVNFDIKVCGRFAGVQAMRQVLDLEEFTGAILPGGGSFYVNRAESVSRIQSALLDLDDIDQMVDEMRRKWAGAAVQPIVLDEPELMEVEPEGLPVADSQNIDALLEKFEGANELPGIHKIRTAYQELYGNGIGTRRAGEIQRMIAGTM